MREHRPLRRSALAACAIVALASADALHAQPGFSVHLATPTGIRIDASHLRAPQTVRLALYIPAPIATSTLAAELTSTNPNVFPVPASAQAPGVEVAVAEPAGPTPVTVTATIRTVAGLVVAQTSLDFTIYPRQRVAEVRSIHRF